MSERRRFGGDIKIRPPPRVPSQGRRDYSPPRRQSRDIRTPSPTRASMKGRNYPRYLRTGSPPRVAMQSRESRDYSRPHRGSRERHSEMEKSRGDYGWHLDEDRDRPSQKLSQFSDGLSRMDSSSTKFHWKHIFEESNRTNANENHCSKHYPDYGISSARLTAERSYQSSGLADISRSGVRVEKPMPTEVERGSNFPASYPREIGTRRSYDGDGLLLSSQKLNIGLHKNEDLLFQDQMPADKLPARNLHKGEEISTVYSREEKPPIYSTDASRYSIPSTQSKAPSTVSFESSMDHFHDSLGDGFPPRSDGFKSPAMLTEPICREAHCHISHLKTSRDRNLQLDDTTSVTVYRQVQLSPNVGTHGGYTYPEVRRDETIEMGSLSNRESGMMASVQDGYGQRDLLGSRIVELINGKVVIKEGSHREHLIAGMILDDYRSSEEQPSSHRKHLVEGTLWDQYHSPQKKTMSNYLDAAGSSYASKKDGEALDHRSVHLEYEREVYEDHGNTYTREDHGYGRDASFVSDDERLSTLMMNEYDPGLDGIDIVNQEGFGGEELDLVEQPRRTVKQNFDVEAELSRKDSRSRFSSNSKIHFANSSRSLMTASQYSNVGSTIHDVGPRNSTSVAYGGQYVPTLNSKGRDLKKRLGPCRPVRQHVHMGSHFRDIKKRLGPRWPVRQHVHMPHPSVRKRMVRKLLRRDGDGCHESVNAEEEGHLEGNLPDANSEPHEKSEEFKQLVHSAFLKFVKQLNENPGQRRRLKEQGKGGSLKCHVCGSDSEGFLDTQNLVLHACTSPKVGLRAQHLGLHKAVCTLMGWKSAEILNNQWACQLLPDAETVALKEDLIIWPPVVVIRNSSIGNVNPDGRVVVPVDMLEGILKDMGFGGKTKVYGGEPANQSVMVVKFSGTFSGFQEAEKLHKNYADNKHGRTEFQRINPNDPQKASSASKVEQILYGYLGNAEDFDKLDFDTKKRCFVKSKKEIQEIADAALKTE